MVTDSQSTRLLSTSSGSELRTGLPTVTGVPSVVWSDATLFYLPQQCPTGPCYQLGLVTVDNRTRAVHHAALPPVRWLTELWLTQRGSSLVALGTSSGEAEILAIDGQGNLPMQCALELARGRTPHGPPVLMNGRYAMLTAMGPQRTEPALEVWTLPGYGPAAHGWISPRGGPGLDWRER
jgi:hypothetical protein